MTAERSLHCICTTMFNIKFYENGFLLMKILVYIFRSLQPNCNTALKVLISVRPYVELSKINTEAKQLK